MNFSKFELKFPVQHYYMDIPAISPSLSSAG